VTTLAILLICVIGFIAVCAATAAAAGGLQSRPDQNEFKVGVSAGIMRCLSILLGSVALFGALGSASSLFHFPIYGAWSSMILYYGITVGVTYVYSLGIGKAVSNSVLAGIVMLATSLVATLAWSFLMSWSYRDLAAPGFSINWVGYVLSFVAMIAGISAARK
jgi:hypothetical protein